MKSRKFSSMQIEPVDQIPLDLSSDLALDPKFLSNKTGWWSDFLRKEDPNFQKLEMGKIRVLDLFSSVGGLSLGASVAAGLLGKRTVLEGAADTDKDALTVHRFNFGTRILLNESVRDLVDFRLSATTSSGRSEFRYSSMSGDGEILQSVDLLIGGPPCQGHSTLNNFSRGNDPKNELMLTMPAVAVAMNIPVVVIENVPNVVNDSKNVVQTTTELFQRNGYAVTSGVISANELGWPQTRKRFFMIARLDGKQVDFGAVVNSLRMQPQPLSWVISDLIEKFDPGQGDGVDLFNSVPRLSQDNVRRIKWLFDNDEYDLVNHERPKCHQEGHTYPATYGRMRWDRPAPTITTGFMTPGRGRFVHPLRPRVLTAHEAARVQGFPDWFNFSTPVGDSLTRSNLSKWIGDAVPSVLGAAAVLAALS